MLTVIDALDHLGYDEADAVVTRLVAKELDEARAYMKGAVGKDIFDLMPDDDRVDMLLKAYLDDLHDDRGTTSAKAANAKREMIHSTEWQLRMELARKREEVAAV
jgi:hypothetical protein